MNQVYYIVRDAPKGGYLFLREKKTQGYWWSFKVKDAYSFKSSEQARLHGKVLLNASDGYWVIDEGAAKQLEKGAHDSSSLANQARRMKQEVLEERRQSKSRFSEPFRYCKDVGFQKRIKLALMVIKSRSNEVLLENIDDDDDYKRLAQSFFEKTRNIYKQGKLEADTASGVDLLYSQLFEVLFAPNLPDLNE